MTSLPLVLCRRWAGHNRWSKVRTVKGPRDADRGRLFQRLSLRLRAAVKDGGPDPALNAPLANMIEQCRASNMPKSSIEAAIEGALRPTASSPLLLQARAPQGVSLLLWVQSSDPRRSQRELSSILSRYGAALAAGVLHDFQQQGVVRVGRTDAMGQHVGQHVGLELALEVGAQDVREEEEEPSLVVRGGGIWGVMGQLWGSYGAAMGL
uniref:Uncharacterized protein n=1 Tax=Melopsittacus undulatus TaxID=13146 RepID=A0A8V5GJA4_MELUD